MYARKKMSILRTMGTQKRYSTTLPGLSGDILRNGCVARLCLRRLTNDLSGSGSSS